MATQNQELLTFNEVKQQLRISERTLRRLTAESKIAFVKVGGSIKFKPSDVQKYIKENTKNVRY